MKQELSAKRQMVYKDIEQTLGVVPTFLKLVPDSALEMEWNLMKQVQLAEGPIPNKYRELIGIAISAITHCRYCSFYHTEIAKLNGATEAEIEDAVHFAKSTAGWSTYVNGMQLDYDQFTKEISKAVGYIQSQTGQGHMAEKQATIKASA